MTVLCSRTNACATIQGFSRTGNNYYREIYLAVSATVRHRACVVGIASQCSGAVTNAGGQVTIDPRVGFHAVSTAEFSCEDYKFKVAGSGRFRMVALSEEI